MSPSFPPLPQNERWSRAVEVKEIVYQAIPYVGMGKVFDFLNALRVIDEVAPASAIEGAGRYQLLARNEERGTTEALGPMTDPMKGHTL
jgi:hypothetical protein